MCACVVFELFRNGIYYIFLQLAFWLNINVPTMCSCDSLLYHSLFLHSVDDEHICRLKNYRGSLSNFSSNVFFLFNIDLKYFQGSVLRYATFIIIIIFNS